MPLPEDFAGTHQITVRSRRIFTHLQENPQKYALLAVTLNNEPTNAIIRIETTPDGDYNLFPVYVEITPRMMETLKDPDGKLPQPKPQE